MKSLNESIFSDIKINRYGYGGQTPNQPINASVGPYPATPTGPNILTGPMEIDHCANLFGWQQQLVTMLGSAKDIYIIAAPGSGKTPPVICYWVNQILGISTSQPPDQQNLIRLLTRPQDIPKVLWLVPIKNLSANIEQEMIERFVSIILQILNRTCYIDPTTNDVVFFSANTMSLLIKSMSNFGGFDPSLILNMISNDRVLKNNISEFKTSFGNLVRNYVKNALVGRIEEGIYTVQIKHHSINTSKPFIISIYESAQSIIGSLDNLNLIIFDEAQRIQGGSDADDERARQIGDSIHKVLFHRNGRKAKIVMLSGSVNRKSAANIMHFLNVAYDRNFDPGPYQPPGHVRNPSDIRVHPVPNLNDFHNQLRIIETILSGRTLTQNGVVFIIFGKQRINELIDKLVPTERGHFSPKEKLEVSRDLLYNIKKDTQRISDPGGILDISDERLRRAASRGIGYLYRPEEMTPIRQHDTTIVQNLFRAGIIKVIFATDAVREGINITCKELYIPTILLPPDNREMDPGSLVQLINRVGRKSNKYATIYTDPKFVRNITDALSRGNDQFNKESFILPGSKITKLEAGLNYGLNLPVEAAKDIYRLFRSSFNVK
ncbi:MAG TPA: hypothetical protein PLL26_06195 [Candidatus Dojkabacteria bacterium]|nr:hypothetical protein [Candidatus Dojkabacteria bacterium]